MTGASDKQGSGCQRAAIVFVAAAVIAYNLWVRAQRQTLFDSVVQTREANAVLQTELKEGEKIRSHTLRIQSAARYRDKALVAMLRKCRGREDFVVREGPRLAWSELSGSAADSSRLGIYVPEGRHRLKFGVLSNAATAHEYRSPSTRNRRGPFGAKLTPERQRQRFHEEDARRIVEASDWKLPESAEVYEIRFQAGEDDPLRISLLGPDGARVHEYVLPSIHGRCQFELSVVKRSLAFPSELKPDNDRRPYFTRRKPPPAVDLAMMYVRGNRPGEHADIRLWIESEATACMPAVDVAARYRALGLLGLSKDPPENTRLLDLMGRYNREFRRLFQPYDGSDRFYFRSAVFSVDPARR